MLSTEIDVRLEEGQNVRGKPAPVRPQKGPPLRASSLPTPDEPKLEIGPAQLSPGEEHRADRGDDALGDFAAGLFRHLNSEKLEKGENGGDDRRPCDDDTRG